MAVGRVNFGTLSINVKDASKYGISDNDVTKINRNGDDKITCSELQAAGLKNYSGLTNHFNQMTNGALLAFQGNIDSTQRVGHVGQINPIESSNNFVKHTFAFSNANPNRPEHRDSTGVDLLGYPKKGQNVYLLG